MFVGTEFLVFYTTQTFEQNATNRISQFKNVSGSASKPVFWSCKVVYMRYTSNFFIGNITKLHTVHTKHWIL